MEAIFIWSMRPAPPLPWATLAVMEMESMNTLLDFIIQPLGYAFMVRGLIAALLTGIVCATVGSYVVLRGMAFFGDALAHALLPGIAIGYLVSGGAREPVFWWALLTAVLR